DPAIVHAMPMGAPLLDGPVLVRDSGPAVYAVDAAPPSYGVGSGVGVAGDTPESGTHTGTRTGTSTAPKRLPPSVVASCASAPSSTFAVFGLVAIAFAR